MHDETTENNGLVPQPHGGALRHFQPGQSGNPGGRPARKRLTEAYNKILDLTPAEFEAFEPATVAEIVALGQIKQARERTFAAREIGDRVEGKAKETIEHQGNVNVGALVADAAKRATDNQDAE